MTDTCAADADAISQIFPAGVSERIPFAVYALGAGIFAMTTAEFMVAGLMPELAAAFGVTTARVGYLISIYSAGMVVGGPVLTVLLLGAGRKRTLVGMMIGFILGQALAASAVNYEMMAIGRFITGATSAAFFAVSLSAAADMVGPHARGRAASVVLAGLMLATVLGVPIATFLGQMLDWRTSFWAVGVLVAVCTALVAAILRSTAPSGRMDLANEVKALANRRLWAAYATSGLIIAATFSAFSYFSPIFIEVSGFDASLIPFLFAAYGAATVVGNIVVGRFADRYTLRTLLVGIAALTLTLVLFGLLAQVKVAAVALTIALGLVGVTMNPAMAARVMRVANPRPLVNALHGAVISLGVLVGSWFGGLAIGAGQGVLAPVWIGAALGALALLSLAPREARAF